MICQIQRKQKVRFCAVQNVGNDTCDKLHFFKYVLNPQLIGNGPYTYPWRGVTSHCQTIARKSHCQESVGFIFRKLRRSLSHHYLKEASQTPVRPFSYPFELQKYSDGLTVVQEASFGQWLRFVQQVNLVGFIPVPGILEFYNI